MMKELYEKMINESVAALQADIDVISANLCRRSSRICH